LNFECQWRGEFESTEVDLLHVDAFGTSFDAERCLDWRSTVAAHSLGWVTARDEGGRLIGFANVLWDGALHAWLQDVMVTSPTRSRGVGTRLVAVARDGAARAGCDWLHVDFEEDHRPFYLDACGFRPANAGLIRLTNS
jgi:GNAT superfamily N-acetyltransferase